MDPVLFIVTLVSAGIAGATVLLPSAARRHTHHWEDDDAGSRLNITRR